MEYKVLKYFRLSIDKTGKDIINLSTGSIINISVLKKNVSNKKFNNQIGNEIRAKSAINDRRNK